jgi:hypothetical protein
MTLAIQRPDAHAQRDHGHNRAPIRFTQVLHNHLTLPRSRGWIGCFGRHRRLIAGTDDSRLPRDWDQWDPTS